MIMIDWVTAVIPYEHKEVIADGTIMKVDSDGELKWQVTTSKRVEGSYSDTISINSVNKVSKDFKKSDNSPVVEVSEDFSYSHIRIDGNLVKFIQGHNIWGTNNLQELMYDSLQVILSELQGNNYDDWALFFGIQESEIIRIDITQMRDLESPERVRTWLQIAEQSASLKHRGRGQFTGDTLYFGKHSRRWALKFYHKGSEILKHKPKYFELCSDEERAALIDYANKSLRIELVLRSMELKKLGLNTIDNCTVDNLLSVFAKYSERLSLSENMKHTMDIMDDVNRLKGAAKSTYASWKAGYDTKSMLSQSTWYRHRNIILKELNVDIAVMKTPDSNPELINVVIPPLTILESKPASIPLKFMQSKAYYIPSGENRRAMIDHKKKLDDMRNTHIRVAS